MRSPYIKIVFAAELKLHYSVAISIVLGPATLTVARTIDQNDHNTKAMAHQNSEQCMGHGLSQYPMVTNVHYISELQGKLDKVRSV